MKILLDESVPVQVSKAFEGHDVFTVRGMGWGGFSNGDLLSVATREGFQVLIIADKNLSHQQNLSGIRLTIVELWTNHRPTLERYLMQIRAKVDAISSVGYFALEDPEGSE